MATSESAGTSAREAADREAFDAFLVYNHRDRADALIVAEGLRQRDIRAFLDPWAIFSVEEPPWPAEKLREEAAKEEAAFESAPCAVVLLGGSGWGPRHRELAEKALSQHEKRVLPVALPDSDPEAFKEVDGRFLSLHRLELRSPDDPDGLDLLASVIRPDPDRPRRIDGQALRSPLPKPTRNPEPILELLIDGNDEVRTEVLDTLTATASRFDDREVRRRIAAELRGRYSPGAALQLASAPREPQKLTSIRSWLLSALIHLMSDDEEARETVQRHLSFSYEPEGFVRFWGLAELWRVDFDLGVGAAQTLGDDPDASVRSLRLAVLGRQEELAKALHLSSFEEMWPALRALRIVAFPDLAVPLVEALFRDLPDPAAYDILWAIAHPAVLGRVKQQIHATGAFDRLLSRVLDATQGSSRIAQRTFARVLEAFPRAATRRALRAASTSADDVRRAAASALLRHLPDDVETTRVAGLTSDAVVEGAPDLLEIERDVKTLCAVLLARDLTPPISVGLFGDWGAGKTFFMQRMYEEVRRLTTKAHAGSRLHCRVAQIRFNAWHYIDANLWASLVSFILEELARMSTPDAGPEQVRVELLQKLETAQELRAEALRQKQVAESERQEAENNLSDLAAKRADAQVRLADLRATDLARLLEGEDALRADLAAAAERVGVRAAVDSVAELDRSVDDAYSLAGRVRALAISFANSPSRGATIALVLALLIVFPIAAWGLQQVLDLPMTAQFSAVLAEIVAFGGAVAAVVRKHAGTADRWLKGLESARQRVNGLIAEKKQARSSDELTLEKQLNELRAREASVAQQLAAAEARVHMLQAKLREIDEARSLSRFLLERVGADDYRKHLGIISTIRRDFEHLSDIVRRSAGEPRSVDRIVLYIDDLDRCPSKTVVEVLQAVHLLLAFPLFVVVVGVDSRWLLHSLRESYSAFSLREGETDDWSTTPQNYLEKIFQIPFALRPMGEGGFRRLLGALLPESTGNGTGQAAAATAPSAEAGAPRQQPLSGDAFGTPRADQAAQPGPDTGVPSATAIETPMANLEGTALPASGSAPEAAPDPEADCEVNPDSLQIRSWESRYAGSLHRFVTTPRAAKRFSNVYRLLKANVDGDELAAFEGTEQAPGDFRAVMVLLAILTQSPSLASDVFRHIAGPGRFDAPHHVFDNLRTRMPEADAGDLSRLIESLGSIREDLPEDMEPFARWAPRVARFAFETAKGAATIL